MIPGHPGHWYTYDRRFGVSEGLHDYELNSIGRDGVYGPHIFYDHTADEMEQPVTFPDSLKGTHIDEVHEAILAAFKKKGVHLYWQRHTWDEDYKLS
jgi:hypothetical protein